MLVSWFHPSPGYRLFTTSFWSSPCSVQRKPNESMRLVVVTIVGVVFGFFIGISFPTVSITKVWRCSIDVTAVATAPTQLHCKKLTCCCSNMLQLHFPSSIVSYIEDKNSGLSAQAILNHAWTSARNARGNNGSEPSSNTTLKVTSCSLWLELCFYISMYKDILTCKPNLDLLW